MNRVSFGFALLLVSPGAALSQTTFSLGGGLNVPRSLPSEVSFAHGSTTQGFALQASLERPYRDRFAWRIDLFASQFGLTQPSEFAGVLCQQNPPPGTCCGICAGRTDKGTVGVAGVAMNQLVRVTRAASSFGMYLLWGAEADYLYQHPTARGALRLGASVGGGVTLPVGGHVRAFVEARYHHLFDGPSAPTGLMPITFGLQL